MNEGVPPIAETSTSSTRETETSLTEEDSNEKQSKGYVKTV